MEKAIFEILDSAFLKKIYVIFSDYPGILKNTENFINILNKPFLTEKKVKEIESHIIKYSGYYIRHSDGIYVVKVLLNYLLQGIEKKQTEKSALITLLKVIEKIIEDDALKNQDYRELICDIFSYLNTLDFENYLSALANLKKIGKVIFNKLYEDSLLIDLFVSVYQKYLKTVYEKYLSVGSFLVEFKKLIPQKVLILKSLSDSLSEEIQSYKQAVSESLNIENLLSLPSETEILIKIKEMPKKFPDLGDAWSNFLMNCGYLLWILNNEKLEDLYDFSVRELGRVIKKFLPEIINYDRKQLTNYFELFFQQIERFFYILPEAVMFCIEEIGNKLHQIKDKDMLNLFNNYLISLGFHTPEFKGLQNDYTININRNHLRNLRLWFDLISKDPAGSKELISALVIYLFIGGVHVKDTDLFQKEITKILNSDISQLFYIVKPLLKIIPVYFNEINAEGQLRTVSTQVDEIFQRKDPLMHFIRKQIHVESSPVLIDLVKETINFWITGDISSVKNYISDEIVEDIDKIQEHISELGKIFRSLLSNIDSVEKFLSMPIDAIAGKVNSLPFTEISKNKAILTIRLYQLLHAKYNVDYYELENFLKETLYLGLPDGSYLLEVLAEESLYKKIELIVSYLESLKEIILSPQKHEAVEDISHKRHIVAGIPSITGRYSEKKFNALSVYFRLENLLDSLLDKLEQSIDITFITRAALFKIEKYLKLFLRILQLNGISSQKFTNILSMLSVALEIRRFTFSQYMDIFRNLSESVSDIVNTYCTAPYKNLLKKIIRKMEKDGKINFSFKEEGYTEFELISSISEKFLREMVVKYPGLSQLDRLIGRIIKTSYEQAEKLAHKDLDLLMTYDPKKILCDIYSPTSEINDRIHLGNKGHNLIKIATMGIPVPPGFILTSEVFRCREAIDNFEPVKEHLKRQIKLAIKRLEDMTNKKFGDPNNPLLVSVRSGGAISMPGMMNSFLNVGINEKITEGLIKQTGKPWFVWDSYRRFLQCWGMSYGIDRDEFDTIIDVFKKKYKVDLKIQLSSAQMKEVALAYKELVQSKGIEIEEDPWNQLEKAISQVFNSWYSEKAKAYREILGISEDWGTAVVVQKMVFGNLDLNSGSGVLFTRNPREHSDKLVLWGDFTTGAQGEDIVSGLVKTYPLSVEQKIIEGRTDEKSLEESFPELYSTLKEIAEKLVYSEKWDHQEMEFTFEGRGKDNLYVLQTREMGIARTEFVKVFIPSEMLTKSKLGTGIGVSGAALSGRIVFDVEDIKEFKSKEPDRAVILVRSDTVPDDIVHIASADGILTARGGSTSHASIIATKLGKTCVVGFSRMLVYQNEKKCRIGKKLIKKGDFISIDGRSGLVYLGEHPIQTINLTLGCF